MLNLILAVIMQNFTRICQIELEEEVIKTEKEMNKKGIPIGGKQGQGHGNSKSVDNSIRSSHRS